MEFKKFSNSPKKILQTMELKNIQITTELIMKLSHIILC